MQKITLGSGCFWCVEAVFQALNGVEKVTSGYSGGKISNPTYREVCSGLTGHAEVVQLEYDESQISLQEILEVFFKTHDPTTLNRQGADKGTQYRSAIFYHNENQKELAEKVIKRLDDNGAFDDPIVTEVTAFEAFYKAEEEHQDYFAKNPEQGYCQMVVRPKVEKFKQAFAEKLK
ncbi:MAG: peptide-methionine (S)-S-oxide reductase MsrA [Vicingaceae bacterium]